MPENTARLCEILPILWTYEDARFKVAQLFGCSKSIASTLAVVIFQTEGVETTWLPTDTLAMKAWPDVDRGRLHLRYFVLHCCKTKATAALRLALIIPSPRRPRLSWSDTLDIATSFDEPVVFSYCTPNREHYTSSPPLSKWKTYPGRAIECIQETYDPKDFSIPLPCRLLARCRTVAELIDCTRSLCIPMSKWLEHYISLELETTAAEWSISEHLLVEANLMPHDNRAAVYVNILRILFQDFPTEKAIAYAMHLTRSANLDVLLLEPTKCWIFCLGLCNTNTLFDSPPSPKDIYTQNIYKEHCKDPKHLLVAISRYPNCQELVARYNAFPVETQIKALAILQNKKLFSGDDIWKVIHAIDKKEIST